jgi:hypothetical protein
MILWPGILPQQLLISGYGEQFADQVLRTQMDAGPAKARRRFTAAPRPISGEIVVTPAQLVFFRAWYYNVLMGGALRFGWVDPFSDTELTNLLTNGGFDSVITGWSENPSADTTASIVSGGMYGNCVQISRDDGTYQGIDQAISLTLAHEYSLGIYALTGTSGDESFIVNINENGVENRHQLTGTSRAAWAHHHLSFTVTDTCNQLHVYKASDTAGTMLFDEVSLVDITTGVVEMRFTEPPILTPIDPLNIRISMKMEILP